MSEVIPRWSMPTVDFVTTDPETIEREIFHLYEQTTGRALAQGDPVRLFLLTMTALVVQLKNANNQAAQQNLLTYAQGQYLDALGNIFQVTRLPASNAVTTLQFQLSQSLANAYTIPKGFLVTNGIVTFATDEELVIAPSELAGVVTASCTVSGAAGNGYLPGQISTIVNPMTFLASAENTSKTTGGSDEEADPELAERIRLAPNSFSVAGPERAYVFHTYSVSSAIIDVAVVSPTPGIVHVIPLIEDGTLPSEEILLNIETYLNAESIRPLTDEVHAVSPVAREFEINIDYWISEADKNKSATIQKTVNEAVEKYRLWQQTKIGRDITPGQLIHDVIGAGAARIDEVTMKPASFIELLDNEVAQCTKVTVNYKGYKPI